MLPDGHDFRSLYDENSRSSEQDSLEAPCEHERLVKHYECRDCGAAIEPDPPIGSPDWFDEYVTDLLSRDDNE